MFEASEHVSKTEKRCGVFKDNCVKLGTQRRSASRKV